MIPLLLAIASAPRVRVGVADPVIDMQIHSDEDDPARVPSPSDGRPMSATDGVSHAKATVAALRAAGVVRAIVGGESTATDDRTIASPPGIVYDGKPKYGERRIVALAAAPPPGPIVDMHPPVVRCSTPGVARGETDHPLARVRARRRAAARARPRTGTERCDPPARRDHHSVRGRRARRSPARTLLRPPRSSTCRSVSTWAPGPPGAASLGAPNYRMSLGGPLLLEPVLARHPKLRLYVMHAGWPMADRMIALIYKYPQVHVDTGVIDFTQPRAEFRRDLKTLVNAGYGRRILFGSDRMVWPDAIPAQSPRSATRRS